MSIAKVNKQTTIRDVIQTSNMTGLSIEKVNILLRDYIHSEIRLWTWKRWTFTPGDFLRALDMKIKNNCKWLLTPKITVEWNQ